MKCFVKIRHQQTLGGKFGKNGLTVARSGAPPSGGDTVTHVGNDDALFEVLFAFGYSAPEIADVIKELADKGSNYRETRDIEQSALEKYGL